MSLIFPSNPALNQTYQSGSSSTYKWNGTFWSISAPAQTGLTVVTASYSERVVGMQSTPPATGTGSLWYDNDNGNMYVKYDAAWVPAQSSIGNAVSASFATTAVTASVLPNQATSIHAFNFTSQSFPNLQTTTITGWTDNIAINAGEWNASTGVFTSAGPGLYLVSANLQLASLTFGGANSEISFFTTITGGTGGGTSRYFNEVTGYSGFPPTLQFTGLVRFTAAGQTLQLQVYNAIGNATTNYSSGGTHLTMQEISSTISL
jgi:hypothetical protein